MCKVQNGTNLEGGSRLRTETGYLGRVEWGGGNGKWTREGIVFLSRVVKTFWSYTAVVVAQSCECIKSTEFYTLKW